MIDDVLAFWFSSDVRPHWFERDAGIDAEIGRRFGGMVADAVEGRLDHWQETADGALALVILTDQFPRNLHRGSPEAFAGDPKAREIAGAAIAQGHDHAVPWDRRLFFYLPFEHSEQLADQLRSLQLFEQLGDEEQLDYAVRHHAIIERFGRFPHRNAVLGRTNTPAETAFLTEPESSF